MKNIQIVQELRAKGYKIKYRVRTDGGIIVTKVNNIKFKDLTSGNKYIRELSGRPLTTPQQAQRTYNIKKFIQLKPNQSKATAKYDSEELRKLTREVQRSWNKHKVKGEGRVTIRRVRWINENKGEEEAKFYLEKRKIYTEGFAYDENVEFMADDIRALGKGTSMAQDFNDLGDKLEAKKGVAQEVRDLQKIVDVCYDCREKKIPLEEAYRRIKEIIEGIK